MRADLFQSRKCIHIKLRKEVHAGFRTKLFKMGLSMQEVLDEFAALVATNDPRAIRIVELLVKKKIQNEIDGLIDKRNAKVDELDHDTLYSMIDEENTSKKAKDEFDEKDV